MGTKFPFFNFPVCKISLGTWARRQVERAGTSGTWARYLADSKCQAKQTTKVLQPKCTSLPLRSKPLQQNHLHFFKNFKTQCGV